MNIIVAVDNNWGIGCKNDLLYSIPEDMQFFKDKTNGKVVIMGLNTLMSLPGSKPLKNRINIILSHEDTKAENAVVCRTVEEVLTEAKKYNPEDVFIIGGQMIYELFLPHCERAYITKVNAGEQADKFFPNVDKMNNWRLEAESEAKTHDGLEFRFCEYVNLDKN
ncbi:MAG: dihydrofolate reductase [Oscillospiraceae bacterium]|nr:dihydrofolate reductase [Oscillospiraceae bacterium]